MKHQSLDHWAELLGRQPYLTTFAALLISAGAALAVGSDNYGSNYQPGATIDQGTTALISQRDSALKTLLNSDVKVQGSDRSVWGR